MGQLKSTGLNNYGQLGQGNTTSLNVFTDVGALAVKQASASMFNHAMAVAQDGTLWGWGQYGCAPVKTGKE